MDSHDSTSGRTARELLEAVSVLYVCSGAVEGTGTDGGCVRQGGTSREQGMPAETSSLVKAKERPQCFGEALLLLPFLPSFALFPLVASLLRLAPSFGDVAVCSQRH